MNVHMHSGEQGESIAVPALVCRWTPSAENRKSCWHPAWAQQSQRPRRKAVSAFGMLQGSKDMQAALVGSLLGHNLATVRHRTTLRQFFHPTDHAKQASVHEANQYVATNHLTQTHSQMESPG